MDTHSPTQCIVGVDDYCSTHILCCDPRAGLRHSRAAARASFRPHAQQESMRKLFYRLDTRRETPQTEPTTHYICVAARGMLRRGGRVRSDHALPQQGDVPRSSAGVPILASTRKARPRGAHVRRRCARGVRRSAKACACLARAARSRPGGPRARYLPAALLDRLLMARARLARPRRRLRRAPHHPRHRAVAACATPHVRCALDAPVAAGALGRRLVHQHGPSTRMFRRAPPARCTTQSQAASSVRALGQAAPTSVGRVR